MCNNVRYASPPFDRESARAKKKTGSVPEANDSRAASSKDYCSKTAISSSLICEHTFSRVMFPRVVGRLFSAGQNKFLGTKRVKQ